VVHNNVQFGKTDDMNKEFKNHYLIALIKRRDFLSRKFLTKSYSDKGGHYIEHELNALDWTIDLLESIRNEFYIHENEVHNLENKIKSLSEMNQNMKLIIKLHERKENGNKNN